MTWPDWQPCTAPPCTAPPQGARGRTETVVLLGVLAGVRSLDDLAELAGEHRSTTYAALRRLRRDGLVTWVTGRHGTIRALVERVELDDDTRAAS